VKVALLAQPLQGLVSKRLLALRAGFHEAVPLRFQ
jgi:hypothetical protein